MYGFTITRLLLFAFLYLAAASALPQSLSGLFSSSPSTFEVAALIPSLSTPAIATYSPLPPFSMPAMAYARSQGATEGAFVVVTRTQEAPLATETFTFVDNDPDWNFI